MRKALLANCVCCGRFCGEGSTSVLVWTGGAVPEPSHEVWTCKRCNDVIATDEEHESDRHYAVGISPP